MKKITITFSLFLFISSNSIGQMDSPSKSEPNFNRWSIDVSTGLNKTVRKFAPTYSSGLLGIGELNVGVRRMFNAYAGLGLKLNFDRFQDGKKSPDFASNLGRLSLDSYANIGNLLNFYQWTDKFGLLAHTGIGVGNFVDKGFPLINSQIDKVGSISFGITPQFHLNKKLSINLDATVTGLAKLHHTFDYTAPVTAGAGNQGGINGQFFSGTIGISYYLGKKEKHADWMPTKSVNQEDLDSVKAEMDKLKLGMNDDDKDGVPNYLDEEANTPAGSPVTKSGIADGNLIDSDEDGIPNNFDKCPEQKGLYSTNGCPDSDGDGVEDSKDKCPNEIGSRENEGCAPVKSPEGAGDFSSNSKFTPAYFNVASSSISAVQRVGLDAIAKEMTANPKAKLSILGHTDSDGDEDFNQILSEERAISAKNYLVRKGITPSRIETVGYGESKPADTNNTESGKAKNRRVEFQLK